MAEKVTVNPVFNSSGQSGGECYFRDDVILSRQTAVGRGLLFF